MGAPRLRRNAGADRTRLGRRDPDSIGRFHASLPGYEPTALRDALHAAQELGVRQVLVKDESGRLGMPSFKILGASWATFQLLRASVPGLHSVDTLEELRTALDGRPKVELVAATDGNHGRAVARMAHVLGLSAHILVPQDMVAARIEAIEGEGATVTVVDGGYDDAIAASARLADDRHLVVSDTSWPGYEDVPGWVIDGYATIGWELDRQLPAHQVAAPDIVAVQIGVGAFAASVVRHFGTPGTTVIGVEPTVADCVLASVEAGRPITLREPQTSVMAGLNCGTPSLLAWPDLLAGIDVFAAVPDGAAEDAMRLLARDDIVSGASGAAGLAGLLVFRDELALHRDQTVLVISTEGATDPGHYRATVPEQLRSPLGHAGPVVQAGNEP